MSYIGPITQDLIDTCVNEFKKKDTREKISKNIVDPIVLEIKEKFYNYYLLFIILQFVIICLLIYIIIITNMMKKNI